MKILKRFTSYYQQVVPVLESLLESLALHSLSIYIVSTDDIHLTLLRLSWSSSLAVTEQILDPAAGPLLLNFLLS